MNTVEIIMTILFSYIGIHAIMAICFCTASFPIFFTPGDLYQSCEMNKVGCLIVYLLLIVSLPLFTIGGMLYKSIKWLFTVGRKD